MSSTPTVSHSSILARLITAPAVPERVYRSAHWAVDSELLQWARARAPLLCDGGLQLISGSPEAGKTFAALYLAMALRMQDKYLTVGFFTAPDISRMMFEDKKRFGSLSRYGCLIVDDLGTNPLGKSDWTALQWDDLVNRVYTVCGALILTSNLTVDQIEEQYGGRIASRFREGGDGWCKAAADEQWRSKGISGEWAPRPPVGDYSEPFGPPYPRGVFYVLHKEGFYLQGIDGRVNVNGGQFYSAMPADWQPGPDDEVRETDA